MASSSRSSLKSEPLKIIDFGIENIMSYCDHISNTYTPDLPVNYLQVNAKASKLAKEKFVSKIEFVDVDDYFHIYAKVKAEMKKKTNYPVSVKITKNNEVLTATCNCPGGDEPACCKHALALLYVLENYSKKELYKAPTEQLQIWHQAKPKLVSPIKFSVESTSSEPPLTVNYEALNEVPFYAPIFDVIDDSVFDVVDAAYKKSVPLPLIVSAETEYCKHLEKLEFNQLLFLQEKVCVSFEEAVNLERKTLTQAKCEDWHKARINRLTASMFFDICSCKMEKKSKAMTIYESHFKSLNDIPAVKYGIENEDKVKNIVAHMFKKYVFRSTGIVINPFFPYLGASPDGLLHNHSDTFIVEIKCIYNPKNLDLLQLVQVRKQFCLSYNNEKFSLKNNHKFMYQIQGQLAITNLKKCLFVLFYKQNNPVFTEEIIFNRSMWLNMKSKLKEFYFDYYLPIIINK